MVELLLSLSGLVGVLVAMVVTAVIGTSIYFIASKILSRRTDDDLIEPAVNLFRTIAVFISLLLSISFANVAGQKGAVENAMEREAAAISEAFHTLRFFDNEGTLETRAKLVEYTKSVIDDDWPALANDGLSERTETLRRQLAESALNLKPTTPKQEKLWSRSLRVISIISDQRQIRLQSSLAEPPVFTYIVMIGFLLSLVLFGVYRPQIRLVVLVSIYSAFVGLIVYLILALSDPFQGAFSVSPAVFEQLLETFQAEYP
jgi:phage shock protein PspC (stress-responsive transcriptional regulator)